MRFAIVGVAEFPFDGAAAETVAGPMSSLTGLCGDEAGSIVDMLLVRSNPSDGSESAAAAIRTRLPGLHVVTNGELVERFSRVEFSYFRQISFVLATVTMFFAHSGFIQSTSPSSTIAVTTLRTSYARRGAVGTMS